MAKKKPHYKVTVGSRFDTGDKIWFFRIVGDPHLEIVGPLEITAIKIESKMDDKYHDTDIVYSTDEGVDVDDDDAFSTFAEAGKAGMVALRKYIKEQAKKA